MHRMWVDGTEFRWTRKKLRPHDRDSDDGAHRGSTDDCSVGAFAVKPRARCAAVRLWGLTVSATEQTRAPVPSMHTCDAHVSHSELYTIRNTTGENANSADRWSDVPAGTMDEASPLRVLMPAVSLTARTRP
jgi:hypothetical protein